MAIYLDTETTGLNHTGTDEMVEISIVDDDGHILLNTLLKPTRKKQWPGAEAIHHISPEMVAHSPTYESLKKTITEILRNQDVVIYNADFDSQFLKEPLATAKRVKCCMLEFAEHYKEWNDWHQDFRWQKLTTAARYVHYQWTGAAHRALADVLATRAVWQYLNNKDVQARVEAIKNERRTEHEVLRIINRLYFNRQREERQRIMANHGRIIEGLRLFLNHPHYPNNPSGLSGVKTDIESTYYQLFTGFPKHVYEKVCAFEEKGLPVYLKEKGVPDNLVREDRPPATERQTCSLEHKGLLVLRGKQNIAYLFDRKELDNMPFLYSSWSQVPNNYVSKTKLNREHGFSKKQIEKMKPVAFMSGRYQTIALYDINQ